MPKNSRTDCKRRESKLNDNDKDWYGKVCISPCADVIAGSFGTWTVTYVVGKDEIEPGGSLKVNSDLWKAFLPQFTNPTYPGYVTVSTSNRNSKITVISEDYDVIIILKVEGEALSQGNKINLTYGDTSGGVNLNAKGQIHMAVGDDIEFNIGVDTHGNDRYRNIVNPPKLHVIAGSVATFSVAAPSNQKAGVPFEAVVAALDEYNNIATDYKGTIKFASSDAKAIFPKDYTFNSKDKGRHGFTVILKTPGMQTIKVIDSNSISATSNPVGNNANMPNYKLYWGDIHGHSNLSDGRGTVDEYYTYARDIARLDFSALTDHDNSLSDSQWKLFREKAAAYNKAGFFVTFSAYEWTSWVYGHRCIYYLNEEQPIYRSKDPECDTPEKLWNSLKGRDVIAIPHHPTGLGDRIIGDSGIVDWDLHNDELGPLVEMFSSHGNFEFYGCPKNKITGLNKDSFVQDALIRGHKVGIISSSDSHDGHPGLSGPFHYSYIPFRSKSKGCLVAVYAEELSREAIWDALKKRRCYATTGVRIILDFKINGHMMGEEIAIKRDGGKQDTRKIKVFAAGTYRIEKIDVVRNNVDIYTHKGTIEIENFEYVDEDFIGNDSYYYIRVTQKDGEMAWTSPIWCTI